MRLGGNFALSLCLTFGLLAAVACGQTAVQYSTAPPGSIVARQVPRFTFILFWRQQDASTQQFGQTLQAAAAKRPERASWTSVDIKDPAHRAMVDHYGVSRAPMPLGICVADNGAVTGVFTRRPNDDAIERALVTGAMAEVTKALQEKKIVLVHLQATPQSVLPAGAAEFAADPAFQSRTAIVNVALSDPEESRFLADMELSPQVVTDSMLIVMAPPGVVVGKFNGTSTKAQIAAKLHAAGKCCDDPKCKHNQQAQ
jgi:hypothetical protein